MISKRLGNSWRKNFAPHLLTPPCPATLVMGNDQLFQRGDVSEKALAPLYQKHVLSLVEGRGRGDLRTHCKWNHLENIVESYVKNC